MLRTQKIVGSLLAILLSSCAAITSKKGSDELSLTSEPSGATVYLNGAEIGTTPYTFKYSSDLGMAVQFELRMEGYRSVHASSVVSRNRTALLGDALLLGIPYIVDARHPGMYRFGNKALHVSMYKEPKSEQETLDLPVTMMRVEHSANNIGKLGARRLLVSAIEGYDLRNPEGLGHTVARGMKGGWANAMSVRSGTKRGDEAIRKAKVEVRATLKNIEVAGTEKSKKAYGTVTSTVVYAFYSGLMKDSVLFTVQRTSTLAVNGESPRSLVNMAVEDNARRLMEDEGLYEKVKEAYGAGLSASKGDVLVLAKPVGIAYATRREMMTALSRGVVTLETSKGHGSGFVITNDGYILSNAHVVKDERTVKVRFEQGYTLNGTVVKVNVDTDIALVKVDANELPALEVGDDAELVLGEDIYAIGTPLDSKLGQSVTRGVLSGRREIDGRTYLQTDVSISPGNSGGPLIDGQGKVVGIATLKLSGRGVEGIGFGVPISTALDMLNISWQ